MPQKLFNLGVVLAARSGRPYTVTTGRDDNGDSRALDRPAGVGRNSLQGPGYLGLNLRWSKSFPLQRGKNGKAPRLTTSVDAFNMLNRVNRGKLVGNLSSSFFGESVSASSARRIQTSLRFRF